MILAGFTGPLSCQEVDVVASSASASRSALRSDREPARQAAIELVQRLHAVLCRRRGVDGVPTAWPAAGPCGRRRRSSVNTESAAGYQRPERARSSGTGEDHMTTGGDPLPGLAVRFQEAVSSPINRRHHRERGQSRVAGEQRREDQVPRRHHEGVRPDQRAASAATRRCRRAAIVWETSARTGAEDFDLELRTRTGGSWSSPRPAKGMVRRAIRSRPPERPGAEGRELDSPGGPLQAADWLATYFFFGVPSRSAFNFSARWLISHCCGMLAMFSRRSTG